MIPVGSVINIGSKIAEYFGLIEGVSTGVTRLVHQAFKAAKDNLECARLSSGQNQIDYIKRAKDRFIDAVAVEENENKVLALVGLLMCQHFLGDSSAAQRTLERIDEVTLTRAEMARYLLFDMPFVEMASILLLPTISPTILIPPSLNDRREMFERMKQEALDTSKKLIV